MPYKPFYVSSFENESGLDQSRESFLIPEKAFPELEDAYAWRGRIKRRLGFELLGRLCRSVTALAMDATDGTDTYTEADILNTFRANESNAEIAPGTVTITIDVGNANETIYRDNVTNGVLTHISGPFTGAGVINYVSSTGAVTITFTVTPGAALVVEGDVQYYPALPVMGLRTRESSTLINNEQLIAFDTVYAYQFSGGQFIELVAGTTWSGTNSDFFWTTNFWQNVTGDLMWATNFSGPTGDPIRYFDGAVWTDFLPTINGANELHQSLILLPYKDRLLAMNTWEGATLAGSTAFPQRIRFSQNGDPTDQTNGWLDDVIGRGGFIDIPTNEAIVSAEFIKDTLLVKCERSSWKVIHTGNAILPFVIQQINTELGAESTFSVVPFDRGVFTVGNYGVTTDDSVNVARIDERIPDIVFSFNNDNEGVERVYGIRNFQQQLVYWSFPNSAENPTFPNKILVYNYTNQTYSIFNDSFTCFGYFQRGSDLTWATLGYPSWADWTDPWNSGLIQSQFPDVIGGNQQGYVEVLNRSIFNDVSLSITLVTAGTPDRITVPNHNLQSGRFVKITEVIGYTQAFVAEAVGTAANASTTFTGFLDNVPIESPFTSSLTITIGANSFTDNGNGTLDLAGAVAGTINYNSGEFTANFTVLGVATAVTASYTQSLNGGIFKVIKVNDNQLDLTKYNFQTGTIENFAIGTPTTYLGTGKLTVLNNVNILTKRFSPYYEAGSQVRLGFVDFFLEKTEEGEVTVNLFIDENSSISINDPSSFSNEGLLGDNIVLTRPEDPSHLTFQANQEKIWHRVYFYSLTQNFQLQLTFDDAQMSTEAINSSDVILHAMTFYLTDNVRII